MIRIAAVGDVHVGLDSAGVLRPKWEGLPAEADALLLAGDLTKGGDVDEAAVLAGELDGLDVGGVRLGVVGAKGFGGGFEGASGTEFGEEEMKAFVRHTKERADAIDHELGRLEADVRVVLLHYAPVRDTLIGEPPEIYPFLGSYLLAEPCDRWKVDLAVHGHAHRGAIGGTTAGGVPVRNVAQPVIQRPYAIFTFGEVPPGEGLEAIGGRTLTRR